jgi:hypothetical protein
MLNHETKGIIAEGHPAELAATSIDPRVRDFLNPNNDLPKHTNENSADDRKLISK